MINPTDKSNKPFKPILQSTGGSESPPPEDTGVRDKIHKGSVPPHVLTGKVLTGNVSGSDNDDDQLEQALKFFEQQFSTAPGFQELLAELKEKLAAGELTPEDMTDELETWYHAHPGKIDTSKMEVLVGLLGPDPDAALGEYALKYLQFYLSTFGDDPEMKELIDKHKYSMNGGRFNKTDFINDLKSFMESHPNIRGEAKEAIEHALGIVGQTPPSDDDKVTDIFDFMQKIFKAYPDFKELIEKFKKEITDGTFDLKDCIKELKSFVDSHHLSGVVKIILDKLLSIFGK